MKALWLPVLIPAALLTWPLLLYPGRPRSIAPFDRLPIAHRGLHTGTAEAPENTLPAFRRARQAGVAVELDIRLTADRQVVVVHDNELTRLCGTHARVSALSYAQLCRLPVLGSTAHIPLLRDVLAALGDTPVVCELKQGGRALYTAGHGRCWPPIPAHCALKALTHGHSTGSAGTTHRYAAACWPCTHVCGAASRSPCC